MLPSRASSQLAAAASAQDDQVVLAAPPWPGGHDEPAHLARDGLATRARGVRWRASSLSVASRPRSSERKNATRERRAARRPLFRMRSAASSRAAREPPCAGSGGSASPGPAWRAAPAPAAPRIDRSSRTDREIVGADSGESQPVHRYHSATEPANSGARTHALRALPAYPRARGQGHREAHPAAVADLVPDGGAPAGLRARDQAGRRGLLEHERRGLRAALLRRPRGARLARDRAQGGQALRGLLRGGELLAAARELLPAGDRVLRRGAGRPAHGADAARRRVRLRGAAAPGAPAAHVRQAVAVHRARAALGGAGGHGQPRRPRALAAPVEDRDGDLPAQDDPVQTTTRSAATRRRSAGWTPTTCSGRAGSSI